MWNIEESIDKIWISVIKKQQINHGNYYKKIFWYNKNNFNFKILVKEKVENYEESILQLHFQDF